MTFSLLVVGRRDTEIDRFIIFSRRWVEEIDEEAPDVLKKRMQKQSFQLDHCWILKGNDIIGVVTLGFDYFFSLGLAPELTQVERQKALECITNDLELNTSRGITGTVNTRYMNDLDRLGYKPDFFRDKMHLDFSNATNTLDYKELELEKLNWKKMQDIVALFIDSYTGTVDELIGMFNEYIAENALNQVKEGVYGKVVKELSLFVPSPKGGYEAGVITSVIEGYLFIVIVGVARNRKGQKIGRKLMSAVIEKGKRKGYSGLRLWVTRENFIAKELYKSLGFKTITSVVTMKKEKIPDFH